jgi:acetyl esterase/lipase
MLKIIFKGKLKYQLQSYLTLSKISIDVFIKRMFQRSLNNAWPFLFEVGVLFWRNQFNRAFEHKDIKEGRAYFDSLITTTGETFSVTSEPSKPNEPSGYWYKPSEKKSDIHALYLHGGGYAFRSDISSNFAKALTSLLHANLFMPHYRLTPENPHPAQLEDAVQAYRYMLEKDIDPKTIFFIGDSAGGHLLLMVLQELKKQNLPRPFLSIPLCPWTDIGKRGASLFSNDKYDLVQGYMAVKFGEWLQGNTSFTREQLSPMSHDYSDLGPIYMQAGGKEILVDMIRDFAEKTKSQGTEIMLDVWPEMTHNFQMHGETHPDSKEAFERLKEIIHLKIQHNKTWDISPRTELSSQQFVASPQE